jgi:putative FmdB family regulatory protein
MPTYEYRCNACGHQFEQFQSMKDAALRKCPKCGKNALERLIGTGAAVIFKGSGFYQTDYRSESYKAGEKAATGSSTADSKTGEGASKDTPAPKPDAPAKAPPSTPAPAPEPRARKSKGKDKS